MVSTLVWMKWPTNFGYAITALERLFFEVGVTLAEGDLSRVHFAYPDVSPGHPPSLPAGFPNVSALDVTDTSPEALERVGRFVRERQIDFVLTFDVQPVHPSFKVLRSHGVSTIACYWGATISDPAPPWKRMLKRALLQLSRSRADLLIFESQAMADLAVHGRGVPPAMIDLVPLGVDTNRFRPATSDYVYSAFDIPRDRKVIVFTGHCTPRKGIGTLVEAAIDLLAVRGRTDVCFLICGNRDEESRPYEARYAGRGLDRWIRFAGYRTDVLQIFQSAFCGVLPSSGWDSFTLSSVEMAASGLPIVASRLQGLAEAVRHEETGLLFEPGNASALADALERLLDRPALAAELGRRGRERCERELTIEHQRERLLRAIRRHLKPTRPRQATAATHEIDQHSRGMTTHQ
jgi:glycosyltransferase involved in cell wall biosynthesis